MGKGKRNKSARVGQEYNSSDKYLTRSEKVRKDNSKKQGRVISIVCVAIVAAMLLVLLLVALGNAGVFMRWTSVLEQNEGHYVVNEAMMNFFFNEKIMSWYQQYGSYASYFKLDFSKSFKSQVYSGTQTWYDYFLEQTASELKLYVAYANAAYERGDIKLDDEDWAEIDQIIETLDETIDAYGFSYSDFYGPGVKKSDIRDCYELVKLANKYAEVVSEELESQLKDDDKDVVQYPEDHKENYYFAEHLTYDIVVKSKGLTDKQFEDAKAMAMKRAEAIAKAATPEEFFELMKIDMEKYAEVSGIVTDTDTETDSVVESNSESELKTETDTNGNVFIEHPAASEGDVNIFDKEETYTEKATAANKETKTEKQTETESESDGSETETETETELDMDDFKDKTPYKNPDDESATTTSRTDLENWLFGWTEYITETETESETESESVSGTVTESESTSESESTKPSTQDKPDTDGKYKKYTVTVYCVTKSNGLDTELTRDLGYVISSDKAIIEKIIKDFNASATKNGEILNNLGQAARDALAEDSKTEIGFDNDEKVRPGTFEQNFLPMEEWLETAEKNTLSELIEIKPSTATGTTYYAVIYFEDFNVATWYANATDDVVNQRLEYWYQGEDGKGGVCASNPFVTDEKVANDLFQTTVPYYLMLMSSLTTTK